MNTVYIKFDIYIDFFMQIVLNIYRNLCFLGRIIQRIRGKEGVAKDMNNFNGMNNARVAIIPKGTVVNGNIEINGKLEMYGMINGNICSDERVNICGDVTGNIKAKDVYTKDSFIEGNIECEEGAVVRENTVVIGDISAENLMIDGAIKGKLDIKGMVTVGDKAIVESDIKAKSIQVNNGAALNGHCSLCYADITPKSFFPEEPKKEPVKEVAKETGKKQNRKNAS